MRDAIRVRSLNGLLLEMIEKGTGDLPVLIGTLYKCGDNFRASVRGLGNVVDVGEERRVESVVEEVRKQSV